jgi:crotonobetainyl-CoA:carnitine CoA-transferase CaiB-like acyl-CoA transferase
MRKPLNGVRVLEVAQFTFVPSAGAVLADWGADVVKVEHPVTGDAQRGLVKVLGTAASVPGSSFAPIMEAPNRGKRSVGLALDNSEARPLLDELIRRSDVFLTNYLPSSRKKLSIDVDDVRRVNPDIIYVVGNGLTTMPGLTTRRPSGPAAAARTASHRPTPRKPRSCPPELTETTSAGSPLPEV